MGSIKNPANIVAGYLGRRVLWALEVRCHVSDKEKTKFDIIDKCFTYTTVG